MVKCARGDILVESRGARHFFSIELRREKCKKYVAGNTDEEPMAGDSYQPRLEPLGQI